MEHTTVMVADHHRDIRRIICEYIGRFPNYKVIGEVGDGQDLMQQVRKLKPHMLVVDIDFPQCSGFQAARIVREEHLDISVVIATMFDDPIYRTRALQAGATSLLTKATLKQSLETTFQFQGVVLGSHARS
jgi:two-component system response regulator DegU